MKVCTNCNERILKVPGQSDVCPQCDHPLAPFREKPSEEFARELVMLTLKGHVSGVPVTQTIQKVSNLLEQKGVLV